jgi:hypothetical protein
VGLTPRGSMWELDLGYLVEWISPGFDSAENPRESRQLLSAQIHWSF